MTKAMPKAEAQRILEVKVDRMFDEVKDKKIQDDFLAAVNDNYGHAGREYIQYILNHMDDVKTVIEQVRERIDKSAGLTSENRFWSAFATNTVAGLMFAKRAGLIDYDIKKLFKWTIGMLENNKNYVSGMNTSVEDTLNDYIMEHYSNVLWIKSTDDLRKKTTLGWTL